METNQFKNILDTLSDKDIAELVSAILKNQAIDHQRSILEEAILRLERKATPLAYIAERGARLN